AIRCPEQMDEWRHRIGAQVQLFTLLEKDAIGAGLEETVESLDVSALVSEIAIECGAQTHRHVRRFVALDPESRLHDVDGQRSRERHDEQNRSSGGGFA